MKQFSFSRLPLILTVLALAALQPQTASACFADFSFTPACAGDTVWFKSYNPGALHSWDFGDNSGINKSYDTIAWHVYAKPGQYNVTLFINYYNDRAEDSQMITVGEACFAASFDFTCTGLRWGRFRNYSTGATAIEWNFGDPASGTNNTFFSDDPGSFSRGHQFSAEGNYNVTLTIYNGTETTSITKTITANDNCSSITLAMDQWVTNCKDSPVIFYGNQSPPDFFEWDFGDPNSGSANTYTSGDPYQPYVAHTYTVPGKYLIRLIYSNGVSTDTSYCVTVVHECSCVPGDANSDGEVNMEDLFPIGMYYGSVGIPRHNASNDFIPQEGSDWASFNANHPMILNRHIDRKMADCNGDGTINQPDLAAINLNYGRRHYFNNNTSYPNGSIDAPTLSVDFTQSTAHTAELVTVPIYLGSQANPISDVYGYSFTLNYNPAFIEEGSLSFDLSGNCLGAAAHELSIIHNDYANGKLDIAVVRNDRVLASGYGLAGTLSFRVKSGISGTLDLSFDPTAKLVSIPDDINYPRQQFKSLNLEGDDIEIFNTTGINTGEADNGISVYPNPARQAVTIRLNTATASEISLLNSVGQLVYSAAGNFSTAVTINTAALAGGIYTLSCKTDQGIVMKKVSLVN